MPPRTRSTTAARTRPPRPATAVRRFNVQQTSRYRTRMASERRTVATVPSEPPIETSSSSEPPIETSSPTSDRQTHTSSRNLRSFSPTRAGDSASGVGLLEAEFVGCLFLLVLTMFADSSDTYANKIMSLIKRGTLLSVLFFILALISGIGPNASKISKAIGGLVFVATLLSSPGSAVVSDLDKAFQANWTGTSEHGKDVGQSEQGTQSGTSGSALGAASGALQRITQIFESLGFGIIK